MKRKPIEVMHFTLPDVPDAFIELHALLKTGGLVDSGGAGKAMVAMGVVSVDGAQELRKTAKIRAGQTVNVPGYTIHVHAAA